MQWLTCEGSRARKAHVRELTCARGLTCVLGSAGRVRGAGGRVPRRARGPGHGWYCTPLSPTRCPVPPTRCPVPPTQRMVLTSSIPPISYALPGTDALYCTTRGR
eukprot:3929935-Rhodomonas_salina.1